MELFRDDGCLTEEGLCALAESRLDELGRLEAAEHLSYCDSCLDRYTALLTPETLCELPRSVSQSVMTMLWVRVMQNTLGRAAVAGVAAVLALTMWGSGALTTLFDYSTALTVAPFPDRAQTITEEQPLGKPIENEPGDHLYVKLSDAWADFWGDAAARSAEAAQNS